jgi:Uma2 family endonuclease
MGTGMALVLDLAHPVSEAELRLLSELNPGYQLERSPEGRLWVSPTGGESGRRSLQLAYQLARWNEEKGLGVVFDSSTGFLLPDGSILSPDAAFVERAVWEALSEAEREGFPPIAPEAVFEIRSASQALEELRSKMALYLKNGVRLGVLVDPYARAVEVYRPQEEPLRLQGVEAVSLEPELPGFALRLPPLW